MKNEELKTFLMSFRAKPRNLSMLSKRFSVSCKALIFFFSCLLSHISFSQSQPNVDQKAMQLLDKAIGNPIESGNASIQFEGFSYGLKDPKQIFTLPAYQVVRGGYMYLDGKQYEMKLGTMKTLSDGKLMVVVDEISKTMYVDSLRNASVPDSLLPEIDRFFDDTFGEGNVKYEGQENVNGKQCHKIKSTFTKGNNTHVYYWIDVVTEQLYLMAEWQNNAYDVYWIRSVSKAPKGYEYTVNLPKKEIENYYGYNVIDNRFVSEQLK